MIRSSQRGKRESGRDVSPESLSRKRHALIPALLSSHYPPSQLGSLLHISLPMTNTFTASALIYPPNHMSNHLLAILS